MTAPIITVPANIGGVEATSSTGAVVSYSGVSSTEGLTASCLLSSGSIFALGINTVTCSATDLAGNTGSNSFTITVVDTTSPEIFLIGGNVTLTVGTSYSDSGATANDSAAGNLTSRINVTSNVNTAAAGTYLVQYNVTDNVGLTAYVNRTVIVTAVQTADGGGSSGGGSGSCTTSWACGEWSACNAGSQTRTCSYPSNYCTPRSEKPLELRTCTVPATNNNTNNVLNNQTTQPTFASGITGAVIGTNAGRWSLGILVFLILVGLAWWIVAARKRKAAKSIKKKK